MTEIVSEMRYTKKRVQVLGKSMAYVDTDPDQKTGSDTFVFFHGNITSSYMWRNIMPHVEDKARCIAIDSIGQGDSEKLENSGPDSYRLEEHQRYVNGLLTEIGLEGPVLLMMHDWGAQLGTTWARQTGANIKGIAYTQGVMGNFGWDYWPPHVSDLMRRFKSDEGEELVLQQNFFVEKILPAMVIRELPDEVLNEYRRPYRQAGEDRRPTLTWPREIPVEGEPADVLEIIETNNAWLMQNPVAKLLIMCEPATVLKGAILENVRRFPNQTEATVKGLHYVHEDSPHEIGQALADWYSIL
jgi:haloalkane dehalogenase